MWYSPHGISRSEQQLRAERLTPIEAQLGRDYMLFVGTLNPDVDVALLLQLAERLPERNLILIGPNKLAADQQTDFETLVALSQVHYLGTQHALDLKEYSALAAVGLVPYRQSKRENQHRTLLLQASAAAYRQPQAGYRGRSGVHDGAGRGALRVLIRFADVVHNNARRHAGIVV